MGEKDITEKILEDHNDVFADIINGLIFAGEQRILPESLENTAVHSQYKADDEKVHELERDVAKYWKDQDVQLAICGIENQSSVEKYMPFRIIGYDGTAYRSQLQDKRKEILPVMTIVLYFGTEHRWYGKRNIKGLMKIPEGLDDYINDYKMQVFEVAWLTEEQISRFRSDFKIVANFFVQKRKNKDYIPDDPTEIKHIDELVVGTPCQIAAIKKTILFYNISDEKVFYIDLLCHGVPSPGFWKRYIHYLEKKYNGKVERVDFKDKRNGWIYPFAYVRINNQDIDIRKYDSLYYKDLISRPCCYECRFSSLNRTGDLSIGDLWGAERIVPDFYQKNGVSVVLVNTKKGESLFKMMDSYIMKVEIKTDDAMQQCLKFPVKKPSNRDEFWTEINRNFEKTFYKYTKTGIVKKGVNKIRRILHLQK